MLKKILINSIYIVLIGLFIFYIDKFNTELIAQITVVSAVLIMVVIIPTLASLKKDEK